MGWVRRLSLDVGWVVRGIKVQVVEKGWQEVGVDAARLYEQHSTASDVLLNTGRTSLAKRH